MTWIEEESILKALREIAVDIRSIATDVGTIAEDTHSILLLLQPQPLTTSIAVQFTGATMPQPNNALTLNVGQTSQASIMPFLADGVTPSGGVVSNVIYTFNDPSATVALNTDGVTATVTGVAASTGPITGSASCTVTDTDGVVSQWIQAFTITTNAVVVQTQLTQSVAVQFTDPTPGAGGSAASLKVGGTLVGQRAKVG